MYQQRGEPEREGLGDRGLWGPRLEGEAVDLSPEEGDRYAVVDDLEADHVILVLDRWPTVDGAGHLVFSGRAETRHLRVGDFQSLVDRQRAQAGQPAAGRPLRVGDVFWIRADADISVRSRAQWRILDVTGPARRAARAAQLVAVNPALLAPAEDSERPTEQVAADGLPRPATGAAPPAV